MYPPTDRRGANGRCTPHHIINQPTGTVAIFYEYLTLGAENEEEEEELPKHFNAK